MHTGLRIDVEAIEGGYVVSAAGHGTARSRSHAATTADVAAAVAALVTAWDAHNIANEGAESGATIERRGLVG